MNEGLIDKIWKLWLWFFFYAVIVSFLIQFVLLPFVFPNWYGGNGLLGSSGDSRAFHALAVKIAQNIVINGWSSWKLSPEGHVPAGIASLFYALTVPQPWVLIPLNAALHASSAVILIKIIQFFIPELNFACLCALPFVLFPSAALWYAQIHKEGYFILGSYLFIYGWLLVLTIYKRKNFFLTFFVSMFFISLGIILVYLMRPYIVDIFWGINALFGIVFFGVTLFCWKAKYKPLFFKAVLIISAIICLTCAARDLSRLGLNPDLTGVLPSVYSPVVKTSSNSANNLVLNSNLQIKPVITGFLSRLDISDKVKRFFDNKFNVFISKRAGFITTKGTSNIDTIINFGDFWEAVLYLPRALQIAFLAPFPKHWFAAGSFPSNTFMRKVSGFEMAVIYLSLIFLPYVFWYWRGRMELWIVFSFCMVMMLVYAYIVCNLGTLYRMRYGFIMIFVALGIAGFIQKYVRNNRLP